MVFTEKHSCPFTYGCEFESQAGIVGGGSDCTALSSTFNTTTEVHLSKAPNPQLLPGRRSINGCPLLRVCGFTAVCAQFGWVNCRAQIPSMGHTSRHLVFSNTLSAFTTRVWWSPSMSAIVTYPIHASYVLIECVRNQSRHNKSRYIFNFYFAFWTVYFPVLSIIISIVIFA